MKLSTVVFLVVGIATLILLGTATGWIMSWTDQAAVSQTTASELAQAAGDDPAARETVAIDVSADNLEAGPLRFVGLHAGTLQCVASDFNLGLGSLDGSVRATDTEPAPGIGLVNFEPFSITDQYVAAAVPEPMTLSLLALAAATALLHRGRHA